MTPVPAKPADIPGILRIWNAAIRDTAATFTTEPKTEDEIARLIAQQPVLVTRDPEVIGFATYGPFRSGPGYADVVEHSIYVAPGHTGRGTGRALFAALQALAVQNGMRVMVAGVGGENAGAIAFHLSQEFEKVGFLPAVGQKFGRRHDLVFLQKNIAPTD